MTYLIINYKYFIAFLFIFNLPVYLFSLYIIKVTFIL